MIILGTNSVKAAGGFNVANSCRFNRADSADMTFSMSSGGSTTKFTKSFWIKRCKTGEQHYIYDNSGTTQIFFHFRDSDKIGFGIFNSGAYSTELISTQLFRDLSAWYHIVIAVDYTNGTQALRARIYVNGTEITAFDTGTRPSNNTTTFDTFNSSKTHYIGSNASSNHYINGYLAEVVHIDGQQLAPDQFGEFDEDSGIWKPIDVSGLTFGTKGYYLDFEDSSNLGNDANGGTDWTENNLAATDQSTDTCTNNFATLNPLDNFYAGSAFSEGNLKIVSGSSPYAANSATIGLSKGKWYWEIKVSSTSNEDMIGIRGDQTTSTSDYTGSSAYDYAYNSNNGKIYNNGSSSSYGATYGTNNIISIALDLDSSTNTITFYKDGASQGASNITNVSSTTFGLYFPSLSDFVGGGSGTYEANFGSPPFAISSGNTDGDGFGNFEYAVPSGYFALNTKNLAEYG